MYEQKKRKRGGKEARAHARERDGGKEGRNLDGGGEKGAEPHPGVLRRDPQRIVNSPVDRMETDALNPRRDDGYTTVARDEDTVAEDTVPSWTPPSSSSTTPSSLSGLSESSDLSASSVLACFTCGISALIVRYFQVICDTVDVRCDIFQLKIKRAEHLD